MRAFLFRLLSNTGFAALTVGATTFVTTAPAADLDSICGQVLDSTAAPVPAAAMNLYSSNSEIQFSAKSDNAGHYCFSHVADGTYFLEGKTASLRATPVQVILRPGMSSLPKLVLAAAPVSTEITVTATGIPEPVTETTKQLNIVDVSEAMAVGKDDLASAVRELPGLRVTQLGGPGALTRIQIRGVRTYDTAVLIDGMQFRDVSAPQSDAASLIGDLWFTDTSRVEVLQGGGASLYGTNTIGGAINMVTDQGGGPFHGDMDLQGGMLGQFRGILHIAGSAVKDRLFYSIGGGQVNVTEGVGDHGRYRNSGGLASLDYIITPRIHVGVRELGATIFGQLDDDPSATPNFGPSPTVGALPAIPLPAGQVYAAEMGLPYSNGTANYIANIADPDYARLEHFTSTLAFWEHAVTPAFSYRLSYQLVDTNTDYVNGPGGLGYQPLDRTSTYYAGRIDTTQGSFAWQPVHSQIVSGGYQFDREAFNNPSYLGYVPAFLSSTNVSQTSNSEYLQDQAKLLKDKLILSISARYQAFNLTAPAFSGLFPVYASAGSVRVPSALTGDASIAYFLRGSATKLRSHVGNAYRAPSLYERFGTYFYGDSFTAYGDPRLAPERAISVDAGIDQYLHAENVKLSATYFYTRLQETIAFDSSGAIVNPLTDPFGRFGGYYNTRGGLARGVELSAEAKLPANTVVRGAYTYTNSRDRISEYSDGLLQTPQIVPQLFSASISKRFAKRWDTEADCLIGSHYYFPFFSNAPPYGSVPLVFPAMRQLNLAAGYTLPLGESKRVRIYSRFSNVNNQTYYEEGFLTPGFVARGGVQVFF